MSLPKDQLQTEWQDLEKNWYAIYRWKRTTGAAYMEQISQWIAASFSQIQLNTAGLRTKSFRTAEHRGQIKLTTEINQVTEKRLVRAMFNSSQIPLMGKVIDYEVPLKETDAAEHGDIDLLCVLSESLLCVEAKGAEAGESILKAVLQAFVYTSLISTRKVAFLADFDLDQKLRLSPAILTFASAKSGRQLKEMKEKNPYPQLVGLIRVLNAKLVEDKIAPLRFFIVENPASELKSNLTTKTEVGGDEKAVFSDGFTLSIVEEIVQ